MKEARCCRKHLGYYTEGYTITAFFCRHCKKHKEIKSVGLNIDDAIVKTIVIPSR